MRGLFNSELFFFGENVRSLFADAQIQSEALHTHSPAWAKTFSEVSSREELYHYLLGAFLNGLMPMESLDGISPVPLTGRHTKEPSLCTHL